MIHARVGALVALLSLAACGERGGPAPPATESVEEDPPADALEASLRAYIERTSAAMEREGEVLRGEVAEGQRAAHAVLLPAGWCYKFIAIGDEGIEELDLRLFDPNGVLIQRDTERGPEAVLGQSRALCPEETGEWRVEVRAEGSGAYAARLLRSI